MWMRITHAEARWGITYGSLVHCSAFAEASNRAYINVLNLNSLRGTASRWIAFGCLPNVRRIVECCVPHLGNMCTLNDHFVFTCNFHINVLFAFRCKLGFMCTIPKKRNEKSLAQEVCQKSDILDRRSEIHVKFSEHTKRQSSISSCIEQTHLISGSLVKMHWIAILGMCRSSASFQMDEWQSSSITADTVLMMTSITTVLSLLPKYPISADSASANALCHLWMVESCKVHFRKPLSKEWLFSLSIFLIHTKFYSVIHFLAYMVTHCLETNIISACSEAAHFFIPDEADIFPLTLLMFLHIEHSSHFCCTLLAPLIRWRGYVLLFSQNQL